MKPRTVLTLLVLTFAAGAGATVYLAPDGIPNLVGVARGEQSSSHAGAADHDGHDAPAVSPAPTAGQTLYHCPMHPTYVSDRPGSCPICHMDLVPFEPGAAEPVSPVEGRAAVTLAPNRQELIGVRTGAVERTHLARTIRAAGRVEVDERKLSTVSLKFGGYIEELYLSAEGQAVDVGDPILAIYSPDLLEAENNYLVARRTLRASPAAGASDARSFAEASVNATRERLLLMDITPAQIAELEARDAPDTRATIRSKAKGVVTRRNAVKGAFVEAGRDLFEVADLSTVWVLADVYEYELPGLREGQPASVRLESRPGEDLPGVVSYVYPWLETQTRTARVRIELDNRSGTLKPGMFAEVSLPVDLGEHLVVDADAILDTGIRRIVFVLGDGDRFEPREVTTGPEAGGRVAVQSGLAEGERIVTNGNFLIDSESRLKAALASVPRESHGH